MSPGPSRAPVLADTREELDMWSPRGHIAVLEMVRPQGQSWGSHPGAVPEHTRGVGAPGKHCSGHPPQAPRLQATPPQTSAAAAPRKPGSLLPDLGLQTAPLGSAPDTRLDTRSWTQGSGSPRQRLCPMRIPS